MELDADQILVLDILRNVAEEFAHALGFETDAPLIEGEPPIAGDEDVARALRQSPPLAAALRAVAGDYSCPLPPWLA